MTTRKRRRITVMDWGQRQLRQERWMSDEPVVLAVATYPARADADHDFGAVLGGGQGGRLDRVAAAILEKGADGKLEVRRHGCTPEHPAYCDVLLGGALMVIAAPLGIAFLTPVVPTGAAWAGVGAIVDHFWHYIPRDALRRMSDLLESGQAALVVVAVNHLGVEVAALLSQSTNKISTDCIRADLEATLAATREPKQPLSKPGTSDEVRAT
jgi:Protein of unknown function (DUF1269)